MEYLNKLSKSELKHLLEKIIDRMEDTDTNLANEYIEMIEKCIYDICEEDAREVVCAMKPLGEVYSFEMVEDILKQYNNYSEMNKQHNIDYYITMNMMHNDYKSILDKYNVNNTKQFCYDMSKCFIEDEDGPEYKVSKYIFMVS